METLPDKISPKADDQAPPENASKSSLRLHPFSGALILLVDNVCWGVNAAFAGLATPIACLLAFGVTLVGVFLCQHYLDRDGKGASLAKAFILGIAAGVPTSIAGTALGGLILAASGLSWFSKKLLPG